MDFESDEDRLNRISNEINNGQYRMKRADVVTVPQQYSAQGKFNPVDGNAHLVREIDSEGNVTNFDRSGNPVEPTFGERLSKIWNTVKSYAEENPEIEFPAQTLAEAIGNTITSTAGSVADSVKEMPLYRSVFLTDEERLADAEKIGTAIGINPQILADNQGLYENAKKIYDKQQAMEITGGQLFSVPTIQEMYPEVNLSDPVQAAIALKNAREVIESREAVQSGSIADGIKNEWNFIKNTWTKGYEAGEAGSEIASIWGQEDRGEISLDEAVEKINELEKKAKLPENRGPAETILSETAMQIARNANSFPQALGEGVTYAATSAENILGIPKGTILKWMNTNMALPSFAKYLGNHVLNNPAAALAVNAKFAPSIFIGAFRDSYYDNYQRMRLATDAFGKHKYTKEEARRLAAGEASVQAAIEQKGVEIAFGPVFRILSKGPAAALISNAGAVKALLGAGKQAAARTAMKQAGVQFAKGAAAEIGEEGAQDLVSSIVENALGHEDNSFAEIIKSAGEAMLQAVPSVIGMMAPGAAVHGVGTYRGMKTISVQELKAAQEEIKRENESSLLSRLMELKKSSKLFQKSPESYRTTLQNQMNQAGMGTIYIDAQAAAQNEATHEALNNLVSSGAVTAKELNQAITTGKPLEVKSGKYMQTATPEMNEALSDYTTMDKGERTMHAIREERQRNQDLVDLVRSSQKEREAKAGKAILDKYFPDTSTEEGKEDRNTMVELLTGGLSDIKTNVKNALEVALKDWGDLTGVKDIQDYMKGREGVFDKTASKKGVDTVSLDRDTMIRISENPGWYQDFYKSYGRAPNARELYDIAHRKMEDEVYYNLDKNDAEGMAEKEAMESAKRRVESLERVKDIVDKFDDKDIVAQSLLDPETYEQVYKPTVESLSKGNAAVNKSARDSALILSKMAENFHKNYGLPLKMAAVKVANDIGNNSGLKQMTRKEQSWVNSRLDQLKNYQRQSEREKELEKFKRSEPVTIERKDRGEYKGKPATEIPKLFRAKYPNGIEVETKIGTVKITARGIKNSLSHGMSQAKIDAIFTLSDGLKNAAYMGSLPDKDGKPIINHFFAFKANYEGKPYIVVCRARETTTADNFYVHEIYLKEDIEKAEQSVSRDLANSRLSWGPALLYTSIIRQFLNGRNINSGNEYHQMAGELAKTANMKALKEAKRMLRSRKSMEEISKETGWSIGMDGRWRFYIPDRLDKIDTNDPKVEGEQKVKTEELAEKLNAYFQGEKYLGAYDRANNAIEIFDGANQSTVIHEGAHMYLSMLEEYSALSPAELSQYFNGDEAKAAASLQKMGNDLRTIREWAAYTENHLKEYKGTGLEKEFTQYGKDIENGVEGAEERFMQERFARGFEKYLMDGSAPTKELRGVFRRFKSWLKDIYSAAKNLGNVKLTPEIKDIYDHMLATDKEVEAWAAQRKLDSIDKALNVNASEAENLKKWSEEVKEKAKEIALSYYMKTMKSDALDSFKKSIDTPEAKNEFAKKLAEENPFFKIEQILHSGQLPTKADRENFLKMNNYESEEEFNEAVQMMGGTTEEQYRKHIDSEIRNFKDTMLTEEDVRAMAENVLESPEGLQKRANLEAALLEKRVNQYINEITTSQLKLKRASDKAKAAAEIRERLGLITPEDKAEMGRQTERIVKNEEKISKLEDQVKKLKDQLTKEKEKTQSESKEKSSAQEEVKRLEGNLQAREKELEEERQKNQKTSDTLKDTEFNVAELAVQLSDMVEGLKESRRAMKTDYKLMKDEAASTLGEETISHATSWKWWENKARIANARAMKAASQNNWEESAYQKNVEAQCLVMARTAKDNIEEIKRDLHGGGKLTTQQYNEEGMDRYGVLGIINRIGRKENPVFVNGDARYFVQHLAYMAGITKVDGPKPIDENGMYRDFDWHALGLECNPELGIYDAKYKGRDVIPSWMMAMFESRDPMRFMDLTMNKYRDIITAIKVVYHIGRREQVGNTLGTSFDFAAAEIQNEVMDRWKGRAATPFDKEISSTRLTRTGEKFHKLVRDITLPEIQIERLGKAAYKYIYLPIDRATAKRRQMKQDANKRFREIFDLYSRKEWTRMRSKKEFEYGTDPSGAKRLYTKEQVLSMALNMGTQSNMARLIETVGGNEVEMLNFLDSVMDKRDWEFVTKIWEHIGEYWGERNKIQDHLYGTPMGKVPGLKFTLKSGQVIHGQYYPIKYDYKTSSRSNEYSANDIASMDLQGISAFSLGMGSTKARENGSGGQKLRLDLDVYVSHISEAIQHVSMREATVDVFKLLSRKEVVSSLERTIGTEATNELRQWVSDNWHSSIIEMNEWEKGVNRLRHKFVFATMGYRLSTAILNVLNIFGMMERMGTYNALKATSDFYFRGGANKFRNIKEQYQFIISKSTFMRERAATMDRDMTMGDRIQVGQNEWEWSSKVRHGKYGIDTINSGAFKIIALTDEMFSLPEWLATYKGAIAKMQAENKLTNEEMDREAIRLADKAVRETFGSGEMKDQTSFMRKGGNLAGLTTFFSYTNLVTNQFIRAGYALYDYHTTKPLLRATFFWWILNSFFETCLREMWDDSDDPDKWKKKLLYTFASGGPLGGIPILRDILPPTVNFITKGGKGPLLDVTPDVPAFDSVKYFGKTLQSLYKGDAIETGRNVTKGLTRVTEYTLPDTLVDGYWNFMRMISSDNYTVTDWIYKSMFDKPLKEKK